MTTTYAAALVCALALTGCSTDTTAPDAGGGGAAPSSTATTADTPTPTVAPTETPDGALTREVLTDALLTLDDLPDSFEVGGAESGSTADAGCLALTGTLDRMGAETDTRARFVAESETGAAGVLSKVFSDGRVTVLQRGVASFTRALRDCTSVDVTDADGATTRLEVTGGRTPSKVADYQVGFTATGTVSGAGTTYPYRLAYSVSIVGRTVGVVAAFEVGDLPTGVVDELPRLAKVMVDRLDAATGAGGD